MGKLQIGYVCARYKKDDAHYDEQHLDVGAGDAALNEFDERHDLHLTILICRRISVRQMAGEESHLCLSLGDTRSGPKLRDDME